MSYFQRRSWFPVVVAAAAGSAFGLQACVGDIGGTGESGPPPGSTPTNFVCNEDLVAADPPLRRLSRAAYERTIADLMRFAVGDEQAGDLITLFSSLPRLPDDRRVGPDPHYAGFRRLDQALQQEHVDVSYRNAVALGAALTTPARLERSVGACATDADASNDDACLDAMIRRFGLRALRRPLSDADVAFYRQPAGQAPHSPADYADVYALLLSAPQLFYFVEHGGAPSAGAPASDVAPLDAFEIASRLSYHFWQTLPDERLFELAESGALLDDETYRAEVSRMFDDPRTREAVGVFFREWLENSTLAPLDSRVGTPVFDAFRGDFEPGPELRERMLAEVVDAALYFTFDSGGSYEDLLTSNHSFARTDDLAGIYGTPVWSGQGAPPLMSEPTRAGLLTRAAYLATGSANTRPIMKGVFLRKALLCDELEPPPPNAAAVPPPLSESASTRQVVEDLTHHGNCAGCHQGLINPLGFVTEGFDALGRVRAEQILYDETGAQVGAVAVDTRAVPQVGDEATEVADARGLLDLIVASPKPHACFARQYVRFSFGRSEDLNADGCALAAVKTTLDEGGSIAESLRAIALTDAFRRRAFATEGAGQ